LNASPRCSKRIIADETEMPRSIAIQSERTRCGGRAPSLRRELDRPTEAQSLGQGGLAGFGCGMIAKVRRSAISSVTVLINPR